MGRLRLSKWPYEGNSNPQMSRTDGPPVIPLHAGVVEEIRADDVPEGISPHDHETGMTSSLATLNSHVAGSPRAKRT